jgi:hypothetical protein
MRDATSLFSKPLQRLGAAGERMNFDIFPPEPFDDGGPYTGRSACHQRRPVIGK